MLRAREACGDVLRWVPPAGRANWAHAHFRQAHEAQAALRELAPRVRELGVDAIRAIVEDDEVPASLAWATTMMNEVSDAHAACRWISELFAECDGHESSVNCSWRTLDLVLRVLLRDRYWACEATRFALCETLLLRKSAPRAALPALLRLTILRPIRRGADATRVKAASDANVFALLDTWSGEGFVREASVELQRTLTSSVRAILAALPSEEWDAMRGKPTQMLLKGVSARLDSPSLRPRRHASKVALELSLKMDASKPLRLVAVIGRGIGMGTDHRVDRSRRRLRRLQ